MRLRTSRVARESRRRVPAGLFNDIDRAARELAVDATCGLAALFNSALLDRYFRTLSGNTQVNATEVRTMKFPALETTARIGRRIKRLRERSSPVVEAVVLEELGIDGEFDDYLAAAGAGA